MIGASKIVHLQEVVYEVANGESITHSEALKSKPKLLKPSYSKVQLLNQEDNPKKPKPFWLRGMCFCKVVFFSIYIKLITYNIIMEYEKVNTAFSLQLDFAFVTSFF